MFEDKFKEVTLHKSFEGDDVGKRQLLSMLEKHEEEFEQLYEVLCERISAKVLRDSARMEIFSCDSYFIHIDGVQEFRGVLIYGLF